MRKALLVLLVRKDRKVLLVLAARKALRVLLVLARKARKALPAVFTTQQAKRLTLLIRLRLKLLFAIQLILGSRPHNS